MRRVSRQKGEGKLVGLGIVLLLAFVAWQVYLGATIKSVGIPGIFTVDFEQDLPHRRLQITRYVQQSFEVMSSKLETARYSLAREFGRPARSRLCRWKVRSQNASSREWRCRLPRSPGPAGRLRHHDPKTRLS